MPAPSLGGSVTPWENPPNRCVIYTPRRDADRQQLAGMGSRDQYLPEIRCHQGKNKQRGPCGGEDAGADELQGGLGWARSRLTPGTGCSAHQTAEIPIACRRTPALLGSRPRQPAGFSPGTWGIRSGRHLAKSPGVRGVRMGQGPGHGKPARSLVCFSASPAGALGGPIQFTGGVGSINN